MGGSARIPFVAGLDSYMPSWLGKVHPKYATPHAALIVQGVVSLVLVVINFLASGGVQEAFQTMLSLAVVLQLVPFLYVFAALLKFAFRETESSRAVTAKGCSFLPAPGAATTTLGIVLAFFPAKQISSIWWYEAKMFGITLAISWCWRRFSSLFMAAKNYARVNGFQSETRATSYRKRVKCPALMRS